MGPETSQSYTLVKETLQRNKVPTVILTRDNFSQHIPHMNLAQGDEAVVDLTAGVLYADRALRAVQVRSDIVWYVVGCYFNQAERTQPIGSLPATESVLMSSKASH